MQDESDIFLSTLNTSEKFKNLVITNEIKEKCSYLWETIKVK